MDDQLPVLSNCQPEHELVYKIDSVTSSGKSVANPGITASLYGRCGDTTHTVVLTETPYYSVSNPPTYLEPTSGQTLLPSIVISTSLKHVGDPFSFQLENVGTNTQYTFAGHIEQAPPIQKPPFDLAIAIAPYEISLFFAALAGAGFVFLAVRLHATGWTKVTVWPCVGWLFLFLWTIGLTVACLPPGRIDLILPMAPLILISQLIFFLTYRHDHSAITYVGLYAALALGLIPLLALVLGGGLLLIGFLGG